MEPTSPRIVFFGTPKIAAVVLEKLAKSQYKPQLVITGRDRKLGRGLPLMPTDVKLVAQKYKIAVSYEMSNIDRSFDLAILVAYGHIIPDNILRIPKFGFVNVHPSLLPKYRGPSPITSAILNGDNITGATLIVLDSALDHGPIIAQGEVEIADKDTHDSLATKLANLGAKLLIETLPDYLSENITPKIQDEDLATYSEKITKESGHIDINKLPDAQTLDGMIRAHFPWPTVWFKVKVESEKSESKEIRIKLLPPTIPPSHHSTIPFLIQPEGKKPMTPKDFQNGYPNLQKFISKLNLTSL